MPTASTREIYRTAFDGSEVVDISVFLQTQRRRKTAYEIAKVRIASEISCIGLEAFERLAVVGASGVELAAEVEREIMVRGTGYQGEGGDLVAQQARAQCIGAVGEGPHHVKVPITAIAPDRYYDKLRDC